MISELLCAIHHNNTVALHSAMRIIFGGQWYHHQYEHHEYEYRTVDIRIYLKIRIHYMQKIMFGHLLKFKRNILSIQFAVIIIFSFSISQLSLTSLTTTNLKTEIRNLKRQMTIFLPQNRIPFSLMIFVCCEKRQYNAIIIYNYVTEASIFHISNTYQSLLYVPSDTYSIWWASVQWTWLN